MMLISPTPMIPALSFLLLDDWSIKICIAQVRKHDGDRMFIETVRKYCIHVNDLDVF